MNTLVLSRHLRDLQDNVYGGGMSKEAFSPPYSFACTGIIAGGI